MSILGDILGVTPKKKEMIVQLNKTHHHTHYPDSTFTKKCEILYDPDTQMGVGSLPEQDFLLRPGGQVLIKSENGVTYNWTPLNEYSKEVYLEDVDIKIGGSGSTSESTRLRNEVTKLEQIISILNARYEKVSQDYREASRNNGTGYGTHFRVLFPAGEVSKDTVKAQFRFMAKRHHPDKGGSEESMQKINASYAKLLGK